MSRLLYRQILCAAIIVFMGSVLTGFFAGQALALSALLGGCLGLSAYLFSSIILVFGGNRSAGSVLARMVFAELVKVAVLIVGFATIFLGPKPLFNSANVAIRVDEGLSAVVFVAACVVVVVVHAVAGVILAPRNNDS